VEFIIPYWLDGNIEGAVDKLVDEAVAKWQVYDRSIDDITCILVFLNV
jgi:hypothetical protein